MSAPAYRRHCHDSHAAAADCQDSREAATVLLLLAMVALPTDRPFDLEQVARCAVLFVVSHRLFVWAHELSHAAAAKCLGCNGADVELRPWPSITLPQLPSPHQAAMIRHAGWMASVVIAAATIVIVRACSSGDTGTVELLAVEAACLLAAVEAVQSDLLSSHRPLNRFYCGNFGLLLLQQASAGKVDKFLRRMLQVTMMRGAQSAGVVTYQRTGAQGHNCQAVRHRVVNGKRTDLSEKLFDKAQPITRCRAIRAPQLFQGHTRFATSSIADFSGTHPHQWSPRSTQPYWYDEYDEYDGEGAAGSGEAWLIRREMRNVEGFIVRLRIHRPSNPLDSASALSLHYAYISQNASKMCFSIRGRARCRTPHDLARARSPLGGSS